MSERLTYEMQLQQQWIDLPLPDENLAWADMKRRLEEEDDRPVIAWWRRGCVVWSVLLLTLLAIGWWWFRPEKWFTKSTQPEIHQQEQQQQDKQGGNNSDSNSMGDTKRNNTPLVQKDNITDDKVDINGRPSFENSIPGKNRISESNDRTSGSEKDDITAIQKSQRRTSLRTNSAAAYSVTTGGGNPKRKPPVPVASNNPSSPGITDNKVVNTVISNDTLPADPIATGPAIVKEDTIKKEEEPEEKPAPIAKTDSSKKRKISFSAGIAVHQQIPLAGQKFTPYSASGRKFSLADYLPSVYFRINKENKWFIQTEFRYGAPQYTKEIEYRNYDKPDTIGQVPMMTNTKATVKKTFYHQLPITFNYYVLPNLSIGAGIAWNKFSSAISDQLKVRLNNAGQPDSVITEATGLMKVGRDSVFSSSYFQAVLEAQYKWKRFSFGARYMAGLQPYIKFTLPGGARQEERNSSLQIFIRYQLWRSGKK
jgi:hypothetical protein